MPKRRVLPTQERLRELLNYDPETGVFTSKENRGRARLGKPIGTKWQAYIAVRIDGILFLAHRLAWVYVTGEPPLSQVDHLDGNGYFNAWSNLRASDQSQNLCNTRRRSDNMTGYKGVCFIAAKNRYRAEICFHGKRKSLGTYRTAGEAKAAYDAAGRILHSDFFRSS